MPGIKLYTLKQIAAAYNRPITTTWGRIMNLRLDGSFEKDESEISYTEKEVKQLQSLLKFTLIK